MNSPCMWMLLTRAQISHSLSELSQTQTNKQELKKKVDTNLNWCSRKCWFISFSLSHTHTHTAGARWKISQKSMITIMMLPSSKTHLIPQTQMLVCKICTLTFFSLTLPISSFEPPHHQCGSHIKKEFLDDKLPFDIFRKNWKREREKGEEKIEIEI